MTYTFPSLRTYLYAALCPAIVLAIACGSKKVDSEHKEFPPSVTADSSGTKTATLPTTPTPLTSVAVDEQSMTVPIQSEIEAPAPTTYRGFISRGKSLLAEGNGADAFLMFTKAAEAKPYAYPRIQMARALLSMDMFETARTHAEAAVDMDEQSTFAWNTLGRVELAAGDLDAAIVSFERASAADEHNSYAWNNLGFALLQQQRYQEAAEALESATSTQSPKSFMWNNLAMAYEHLDMLDEARAAYRQAIESGSSKAEASLARLEGVVSLVPKAEPSKSVDIDIDVDSPLVEKPMAKPNSEEITGDDGPSADQNDAIKASEPIDVESFDDGLGDEMVEGC